MKDDYVKKNAITIDRWVEEGWAWGRPISHETFLNAKKGQWEVLLTPTRYVPKSWFPEMKALRILGLASGGGQQMPIFVAQGAECTVFDLSTKQLESERIVQAREGYKINIIQGDMTTRLPFENEMFDMIFHPVSNVYIKDVNVVFMECFRVLKKGGLLLAGLDNGINFIVNQETEKEIIYRLPFDPTTDEVLMKMMEKTDSGVQFSHTLEEQIGGQLKAGFQILDLFEDTNGEGYLHELNIPTFFATKAIKPK